MLGKFKKKSQYVLRQKEIEHTIFQFMTDHQNFPRLPGAKNQMATKLFKNSDWNSCRKSSLLRPLRIDGKISSLNSCSSLIQITPSILPSYYYLAGMQNNQIQARMIFKPLDQTKHRFPTIEFEKKNETDAYYTTLTILQAEPESICCKILSNDLLQHCPCHVVVTNCL